MVRRERGVGLETGGGESGGDRESGGGGLRGRGWGMVRRERVGGGVSQREG